jgi:tetratricopeptide (TPR) repeat protein
MLKVYAVLSLLWHNCCCPQTGSFFKLERLRACFCQHGRVGVLRRTEFFMNTAQNLTLEATLAQSQTPTNTDKAEIWLDRLTWLGRILLLGILAITPWEFGAVDPWAQRQIAIVIGICLAIWWFETALRRSRTQVLPYVFVPIAIGILLAMFQLWELPSWLSSILGRQSELYQQLGNDLKLAPTISMSHEGTRYFIGLLTIAISGMVLGCRYFRTRFEVTLLLTVMTVNGALISFFGMVQSLTSQRGFIYWTIELVNGGYPFGPYVNRNNGAGFLLICMACSIGLMVILMASKEERGPRQIVSKEMPFWRQFTFHLALFLSDLNARKSASIIATVLIGVGIISSLSRGGVLAMMGGLVVTLIFYGMARRPSFTGFIFLPMLALAFGIAGWIGFADILLERFDRVTLEARSTNRLGHWQETWPAVPDMGLLGAGLGSYEHVHRLYRTTPEKTIFVYGESQYFQTLVEMGWPGLVLLVGCWAFVYYYAAFSLWRGRSPVTIAISAMGIFLCVSVMIASAFDFGLYQSANMVAMAVITGALAYNAHALAGRLKEKSWLRFQFPNSYAQVVGLILFSGVFVAGLEVHNRARIDAKRIVSPRQFTSTRPDLPTTERLISELRPLVRRAPISRGLNYLSLLYVQRMRLQHFEQLLSNSSATTESMPEDQKLTVEKNLWELTSPENVHQNIYSLQRESSVLGARAYQQQTFIQENIRHAINALNLSRRSSLLQPDQQIRLTRLYAIIGDTRRASKHASIATELAPGSLSIHKLAGIFHLQSGNSEQAAPFIRRYLELAPRRYNEIADLLSGSTSRKISLPSEKAVLDHFLPDDAKMIYRYVMEKMAPSSPNREAGLRRADELLADVSPADHRNMVLSAEVKLALGLIDEAMILWSPIRLILMLKPKS